MYWLGPVAPCFYDKEQTNALLFEFEKPLTQSFTIDFDYSYNLSAMTEEDQNYFKGYDKGHITKTLNLNKLNSNWSIFSEVFKMDPSDNNKIIPFVLDFGMKELPNYKIIKGLKFYNWKVTLNPTETQYDNVIIVDKWSDNCRYMLIHNGGQQFPYSINKFYSKFIMKGADGTLLHPKTSTTNWCIVPKNYGVDPILQAAVSKVATEDISVQWSISLECVGPEGILISTSIPHDNITAPAEGSGAFNDFKMDYRVLGIDPNINNYLFYSYIMKA